ncbi:integrase core domain-containing protein [Virgibacillus pantothenticus]|uniref:IS3 family transposase n=1 Tax=Virgibacillus pantothenticus TaxID=1473 RepID=UPI0012FEBE81|nr:IS3 family transposase [Virgibacillus sp. 19R1-5]MBU8568571.1 integrase core domain-containing protein [Virgibacillus pantothenticus]MBU8602601.1 integrase core domain-containing protein [Virgibacillus pantothenticus]MBU8636721.1 integrase core domain-containing protein [Virgibacillus pantothenticus]MBU8644400.1 integrase core domain-containing protein [Virgibacillus pantothenticus]
MQYITPSIRPCLEQLALELDDYVQWFNNMIHETLGYLTPVECKQQPYNFLSNLV